jgi:hypothetical protein
MSRTGIPCGYYWDFGGGDFQLKGVAWPGGNFASLGLPSGQRYAFPLGVGSNGVVIGNVTDGISGVGIPGVWVLETDQSAIQAGAVSGGRGEQVELSAVSSRPSGPNARHSVEFRIDGIRVGLAVTDAKGRGTSVFTIPDSAKGDEIELEVLDETGVSTTMTVAIDAGCVAADLNCDGRVNPSDLAILLASWGQAGPADLDGNGSVGASDLVLALAAWTG